MFKLKLPKKYAWQKITDSKFRFSILDLVYLSFAEKKIFCAFIYLKGCGTALKEDPPAAARETLPIVATKLESTAQCGKIPVPPITGPPKMSKSWLIRGAAQYLGKMK